MPSNLRGFRRTARVRSLIGNVARGVGRALEIPGLQTCKKSTFTRRSDGRPSSPIVQVDKIGKKLVENGLAAIWGLAYSGDAGLPEGVVEAALDDEEWYEITDRVPIGK